MIDYEQPDFYRFNEDSLLLVKWILSRVTEANRLADLGAGSGILGIELSRSLHPSFLELLELQQDFGPFLRKNISLFLPETTQVQITFGAFSSWLPAGSFDLMVCNPPYYLPTRGEAARNPQRRICRSFVEDGWQDLINCFKHSLAEKGRGFLVIKNEKSILGEMEKALSSSGLVYSTEAAGQDLLFIELLRLNKHRDQ